MKEKINRFAKGIFTYDLPEVVLSAEQIDITVQAGKSCEGSFSVRSSNGSQIKGIVYSSDFCLSFPEDTFIGDDITVRFKFDASYLEPSESPGAAGSVVRDTVYVVTDCGEAWINLCVHIAPPSCETAEGSIRDSFHFANLAKADWLEAQKVFKSEDFSRILHYYDNKYDLLYRHMLLSGTTGRALEEFLVTAHKKLRINYKVDRSYSEYEVSQYSFMDKLTITKDGWGYGELHVTSDEAFIEPERRLIWTDDFSSNTYELGFVIHPEKLHGGKNYGHLFIRSVYETFKVTVMAHRKCGDEEGRSRRRSLRQTYMKLASLYMSYRLGKLSAGKCLQESMRLLSSFHMEPQQSMEAGLYKIYLQICAGRENAARTALNIYKEDDEWKNRGNTIYGAVLFLDGLLSRDTYRIQELLTAIRDMRRRDAGNLLLFLFEGSLDKRGKSSRYKRYDEAKRQFANGTRSRLIYLEGVNALCEEPLLLKELGAFECQTLRFGLRNDLLTKNVILQASYLAIRERRADRLLLSTLMSAFGRYKINELLEAVCTQLMRAGCTGRKYGKWFRMGVDEQLKVPKLHEYCLYTARDDMSQPLLPQVFMYYSYGDADEFSDDDRAYLYANLIRFRGKNEDIYIKLLPEIRSFAGEQLKKGRVNRTLAVIYEDVYGDGGFDDDTATLLANVVFKYELSCKNENICSVCVAHKELETEEEAGIVDGKACIDIFTEDSIIYLCDSSGNRYCSTISYTLEKLVKGVDISDKCLEGAVEDTRAVLNSLEKARYDRGGEALASLQQRALQIKGLEAGFALECEKQLIYYYYENIEGELLEEHLLKISLEKLPRAERTKMIEFMILRELYHLALTNIEEYGFGGIDAKRLLKLCARLIPVLEDERYNGVLLKICLYIFMKGKYDENVLKFLLKNYNGSTESMYVIWQAAVNFGLDTTDIEERLLGQILFTENDVSYARDIFKRYYSHGCTHSLIKAFLSYYAFGYLRDERILDNEIILIMKREANYEENDLCMLALLKFYSGMEEYSEADKRYIEYQLLKLEQKGMAMPFFRSFKDNIRLPEGMYDKYYVEYHSSPDRKVSIHYMLDGGENGPYITEDMNHVCCGIFVKEFIIFYGECLQYYITEDGGVSLITESREVRLEPELIGSGDTKYHQLNLIITAKEMNDNKTVLKMLESYIKSDYESSRLFNEISENSPASAGGEMNHHKQD